MSRLSLINQGKKREKLVNKYSSKRKSLKALAKNKELPLEERFEASMKLSQLPRNSSSVRLRSRCEITGRPRGYYRKFKLSRIVLRDMALSGLIPGMTKSSW